MLLFKIHHTRVSMMLSHIYMTAVWKVWWKESVFMRKNFCGAQTKWRPVLSLCLSDSFRKCLNKERGWNSFMFSALHIWWQDNKQVDWLLITFQWTETERGDTSCWRSVHSSDSSFSDTLTFWFFHYKIKAFICSPSSECCFLLSPHQLLTTN